jgi:hypothetical protein
MKYIYTPSHSLCDWRRLLAKPDLHWRSGYSAKTLAHTWKDADGFPKEITELSEKCPITELQTPELLLAIPEHKVPLQPRRYHPSQNDLFVLARVQTGLISITIEGKVKESFGKTLGEWQRTRTTGKAERLNFIKKTFKITNDIPKKVRYQLLHRTVSAVLEAQRFHASYAVMIVHAFGDQPDSIANYESFLRIFNIDYIHGKLISVSKINGIQLLSGWVQGKEKYLKC